MSAGAAGAAAQAMAQAQQLLLGGLLIRLTPEAFLEMANNSEGLVITGVTAGFWKEFVRKQRLYLMPVQGVTFYCKLRPAEGLELEGVIEVARIRLGPLASLL